ncbi:MAG: hypothetical protein MMC23_005481 [Stictis urceolatum]|nr:hypothetical protein [Stictis urceolata]
MRSSAVATLFSIASTVSAGLNVNNWCTSDVFIYQSNNGGCDSGPNGICSDQPGAAPFQITAGNGQSSLLDLGWINNGEGTSVKIAKDSSFGNGILQFEYTFGSGGLYWDLSDLDGGGAGLVGTPFASDNVKVSPTGDGEGTGTCVKIRCPANQVCVDAYQTPDDVNTRFCPADTGDMYVDLCQDDSGFNSKKRAVRFMA